MNNIIIVLIDKFIPTRLEHRRKIAAKHGLVLAEEIPDLIKDDLAHLEKTRQELKTTQGDRDMWKANFYGKKKELEAANEDAKQAENSIRDEVRAFFGFDFSLDYHQDRDCFNNRNPYWMLHFKPDFIYDRATGYQHKTLETEAARDQLLNELKTQHAGSTVNVFFNHRPTASEIRTAKDDLDKQIEAFLDAVLRQQSQERVQGAMKTEVPNVS